MLLNCHQRFHDDWEGILALVHEYERELLSHERTKQRATDHQLRRHFDNIVVAQDTFGVIATGSVSEAADRCDGFTLLLITHNIAGVFVPRFLLNARPEIGGCLLQFADPLLNPVCHPSRNVPLKAARDRP